MTKKMMLLRVGDAVVGTAAEAAGASFDVLRGRVGTLHNVILQSKHQSMTAGMVGNQSDTRE